MLKIYDKAQWHIDAGENEETVVSKFKEVFSFLDEKQMLGAEGKEIFELGIDSSISIHERMMTDAGKRFMEDYYDDVINLSADEMGEALERKYTTMWVKRESGL